MKGIVGGWHNNLMAIAHSDPLRPSLRDSRAEQEI
jgi:hypothetical protein